MFFELLAPPICAACASFGGIQGGVTIDNVAIGAGSVNKRQNDGQIEHDTVFLSISAAFIRQGRWSAGGFLAGTFNPTPERRAEPKSIQAGPYAQFNIYGPLSFRLYALPDPSSLRKTQAMFSIRWER